MNKGNTNGTLVLTVKRGDEITVEYKKKDIVNKINSYFGYHLINEIKLKTFNSEIKKRERNNFLKNSSEKFEKKISEIKNKKIKNSLSQFLNVIKND